MLYGVHDKKGITVECSQINLAICEHVKCADISTQCNEGLIQHETHTDMSHEKPSHRMSVITAYSILKANVTGIFCLPL